MKDRLALNIIEEGERSGALKPGQTVIEATSGNTGIGLAMVCAQKGYPLVVTMAESFSIERRKLMRMLGAKVVLTPRALKGFGMYVKAVELAEANGWFLAHQFETKANAAIHEATTAREILGDFAGSRLDWFVTGYGTGGTVAGVGRVLRRERPNVRIVLCEPANASLVADGRPQQRNPDGSPASSHPAFEPHPIQGWTPDFIPEVLQEAIDAQAVRRDREGLRRRGRPVRRRHSPSKEGIFTGISGGATFAAARRIAEQGAGRLGDPLHASRHRRTLHDHASVRRDRSRHGRGGEWRCRARRRRLSRDLMKGATPARSNGEPSTQLTARRRSIRTIGARHWRIRRILEDAVAYLRDVRDRPVWKEMPPDVRAFFDAPVPTKPRAARRGLSRGRPRPSWPIPMGNVHPRFWAWYMGSSNFTGAIGDFLAAIQGSNLGGGSHAAALMDQQVVDWLKAMVGFPRSASGTLVSGGSMANTIGLAVARNVKAGIDVRELGVAAIEKPLRFYGSDQIHSCHRKAVEALGLGNRALRRVPTDRALESTSMRSARPKL